MRLTEERVQCLAELIATELSADDNIDLEVASEKVQEEIIGIFEALFEKEEQLEEEVRARLEKFSDKIDRENLDYMMLYNQARQMLAKQRGIIL
jgi:hypothetical protein